MLMGCRGKVSPPERPRGVPLDAEWHGGADGGAWYKVDSAPEVNHFMLEVYHDYDGHVWAKGEFRLHEGCLINRALSVREVRASINSWSGSSVSLKPIDDRHCALVPIGEER